MPQHNTPRLCFIGFGEAGQAIASGLRETGIETIAAWDILFPNAEAYFPDAAVSDAKDMAAVSHGS